MTTNDAPLPKGIRRKPSGLFEVRYRPFKGAKEAYEYFEHLDAAVAFQREVAEHRRLHGRYDAGRLIAGGTLGQAADVHMRRARHLDDNTRYQYERVIADRIKPILGGLPASSITRDDVERFVDALDADPALCPNSVEKYFGVLRVILKDLYADGVLPCQPWLRVKLPEVVEDDRVRPLTHVEVARLAEAITRRYRALVWVMTYGDLRPGEAYALRRRDLSEDCRTIVVDEQRKRVQRTGRTITTKEMKTRSSKRIVVLPEAVAAILRQHLEEWRSIEALGDLEPDAYVFVSLKRRPMQPSEFNRCAFATAVVAAGLGEDVLGFRVTPRLLRKTGASLATDANVPLTATQQQLGHARLATTANSYAKPVLDAQVRAADTVQAAMAAELAKLNIPGLSFPSPPAAAVDEVAALRAQVDELRRRLDDIDGDGPPALSVVR